MRFEFQDYALRAAEIGDLALAKRWNDADPDHKSTTRPEFWLQQNPNNNSFLLLRRESPIFFFKLERIGVKDLEIHIQFAPEEEVRPAVVMDALTAGMQWLDKRLSGLGYEAVYFRSHNPHLVYFCRKRLGFEGDGRRLKRAIARADAEAGRHTGMEGGQGESLPAPAAE